MSHKLDVLDVYRIIPSSPHHITAKAIAIRLDVHRGTVTNRLNLLLEKGLIEKIDSSGFKQSHMFRRTEKTLDLSELP